MGSWLLSLNNKWMKSCGVFIKMKLLILSPFVSNHPFKFQRNRPIREYIGARTTIACVQPPALRKKTIGEERLWFTVDNRVPYHVIFPGMCGKLFDWLLPIDHYIIETTSFDWLLFLFLHINTVRTTVRDFTTSSCVLWARYKIRIKIFLIVKEVFLLKYERNCYIWSVKWKSIRRTFVGIVVSAKETKALSTRWI